MKGKEIMFDQIRHHGLIAIVAILSLISMVNAVIASEGAISPDFTQSPIESIVPLATPGYQSSLTYPEYAGLTGN